MLNALQQLPRSHSNSNSNSRRIREDPRVELITAVAWRGPLEVNDFDVDKVPNYLRSH